MVLQGETDHGEEKRRRRLFNTYEKGPRRFLHKHWEESKGRRGRGEGQSGTNEGKREITGWKERGENNLGSKGELRRKLAGRERRA